MEVKGLDPAVADKIGLLVQKKGQFDLIEELEKSDLGANKSAAVSLFENRRLPIFFKRTRDF